MSWRSSTMRYNTQAALAFAPGRRRGRVRAGRKCPRSGPRSCGSTSSSPTRRGRRSCDLTREDFEVLEDGKPQPVTKFEPARAPWAPDLRARAPGSRPRPSHRRIGPAGRQIVIVVDDLHLARDTVEPAKQALLRFVGEQVSAEDEIAVVTTSAPGETAGAHAGPRRRRGRDRPHQLPGVRDGRREGRADDPRAGGADPARRPERPAAGDPQPDGRAGEHPDRRQPAGRRSRRRTAPPRRASTRARRPRRGKPSARRPPSWPGPCASRR